MDFEAVLKENDENPPAKDKAAKSPFDYSLKMVKQDFNGYLGAINSMMDLANEHNVNSQDSLEEAIGMASQTKKLGKELETKRKEFVKGPNQYVKNVNGWVRKFIQPLNTIETTLKTKIGQYNYELEMKRQEREKKAQEEAAKLQAELDKEAKDKGIEGTKVAPVSVPKVDNVTRTETGASAYTRKMWKAEVKEAEQVPRAYCSPDMKKVNEAVKAGIREIPGVIIWEDSQTILKS